MNGMLLASCNDNNLVNYIQAGEPDDPLLLKNQDLAGPCGVKDNLIQ